MSRYYNKEKLKSSLELEQIYDLLELWDGEPEYRGNYIVCRTICHDGDSHKLYYYESTRLFVCYTHCGSFDIFDLAIKVHKQKTGKKWELYDAMAFVAQYFGIEGEKQEQKENERTREWEVFERHSKINRGSPQALPLLPHYDNKILTCFPQPHILSWEKEGISFGSCCGANICYYPGNEQIVIPHYDIEGNLIGIRGRFIDQERAEKYGKYRPLKIGSILYTHPLSMNLYNLNKSYKNVKVAKVAIVFESEKSTLQYKTMYSEENDISVAVCGSSISSYHVALLKSLGVQEIIVAFDHQFKEIGDQEFQRLKAKLQYIYKKYNNSIRITAIFDKHGITKYKASPTDEGKEKFEQLLKERIIPA